MTGLQSVGTYSLRGNVDSVIEVIHPSTQIEMNDRSELDIEQGIQKTEETTSRKTDTNKVIEKEGTEESMEVIGFREVDGNDRTYGEGNSAELLQDGKRTKDTSIPIEMNNILHSGDNESNNSALDSQSEADEINRSRLNKRIILVPRLHGAIPKRKRGKALGHPFVADQAMEQQLSSNNSEHDIQNKRFDVHHIQEDSVNNSISQEVKGDVSYTCDTNSNSEAGKQSSAASVVTINEHPNL